MHSNSNEKRVNGLSEEDRLSNILYHLTRIKHLLKMKKEVNDFHYEFIEEAIMYNLYRIGLEYNKLPKHVIAKFKNIDNMISMLRPDIVACQEIHEILLSFEEWSGKSWLKKWIDEIYIILNPNHIKQVNNKNKKANPEFGYLRGSNSVWTVRKK